jgi:NAD(P)-dependent dehydrogenase (short-subunit alcohol dehydrogenase family)
MCERRQMTSEGRSGSFYDYTSISPQNVEKQIGTDHLGHFLLNSLIMPRMLASPTTRIISLSSCGYMFSPVRFDDPDFC